jgi:GR25 family glycosyltransferase involved in LPS biosynthesis
MVALEERLGVKFEYILNYEANELTEQDLEKVRTQMPLPNISCLLKHFEAQRRFLETASSMCLILEDDVILFTEFERVIESLLSSASGLNPGWLIFLGGADNKLDKRFFEEDSVTLIERPMSTAECYLVDRNSCERRIRWVSEKGFEKPADHQIVYMDEQLGISHYWSSVCLASQGSITGDFSTTLDGSRKKHSLFFIKTKYSWNRFRRQFIPKYITETKSLIKKYFNHGQ